MPLIKFSTTEDFQSDVEPVAIVEDNKQLSKRSGSEKFKNIKVPKHQTPVHLIALGSYEGTGCNRNFDYFLEEYCRKNHYTFVKAGRAVHIQHKNKPTDPKYGNVYGSDYNEKMKRVELFIGIDSNASRMAKSLQKLASGKQVSYSMGSSQTFDRCSICRHKSYNGKTDRCSHIPKRLGEITKEGKVVAMENPDPYWFDISDVDSTRGADRIAYSLNKQASDSILDTPQVRYENNLKLASEIYLPPSLVLSKYASSKRALLDKISKMEKHIDAIASGKVTNSKDKYIKEQASKLNSTPAISDTTISELRAFTDHTKLLKALADKGIIFSPEEFYKYIFDNKLDDSSLKGMKSHLPDIHEELAKDDQEINNDDMYPEEGKLPLRLIELIRSLTDEHSLFDGPAHNRIIRITMIKKVPGELKKESSEKSDSLFAKQLALKYANYQLSALSYLNDNDKLTDDLIINTLILNRG